MGERERERDLLFAIDYSYFCFRSKEFLFLRLLRKACVISLWDSLCLTYNVFGLWQILLNTVLTHGCQKMCNAAVTDKPLNRYKRIGPIACDLSESLLTVMFTFLSFDCLVYLFSGLRLPEIGKLIDKIIRRQMVCIPSNSSE